jgi:hypothetical protein
MPKGGYRFRELQPPSELVTGAYRRTTHDRIVKYKGENLDEKLNNILDAAEGIKRRYNVLIKDNSEVVQMTTYNKRSNY